MHVIISAIKFDEKVTNFGVIIFIQLGEIVGKASGGGGRTPSPAWIGLKGSGDSPLVI